MAILNLHTLFKLVNQLNQLEFFINDEEQKLNFSSTSITVRYPLDKNYQSNFTELKWNFHIESSGSDAFAEISSILILGTRDGSTNHSIPCPAGSFSDNNQIECTLCPPGTFSSKEGSQRCVPCPADQFTDSPGSTKCFSCGAGTHSETGASSCLKTCIFHLDKNAKAFDLSSLSTLSPITVPYHGAALILDICNTLPLHQSCKINGIPTAGHVCFAEHNVGRVLSVISEKIKDYKGRPFYSENETLVLEFKGGDKLFDCEGEATVTRISFFCDEAAASPPLEQDAEFSASSSYSPGKPEIFLDDPHQDPNDQCEISLRWKTYAACAACTDSDYVIRTSPCSLGVQKRIKIRRSQCFGPNIKEAPTTPCRKHFPVSTGLIIGVSVIIILLLVFVSVLFYRHRRLSRQYSLLAEEKNKNVEMEEIDDHDDSEHAVDDNDDNGDNDDNNDEEGEP